MMQTLPNIICEGCCGNGVLDPLKKRHWVEKAHHRDGHVRRVCRLAQAKVLLKDVGLDRGVKDLKEENQDITEIICTKINEFILEVLQYFSVSEYCHLNWCVLPDWH